MTTGRRSKPVTSYHLYDFERLTGHADNVKSLSERLNAKQTRGLLKRLSRAPLAITAAAGFPAARQAGQASHVGTLWESRHSWDRSQLAYDLRDWELCHDEQRQRRLGER
jgi:hypothetical protein